MEIKNNGVLCPKCNYDKILKLKITTKEEVGYVEPNNNITYHLRNKEFVEEKYHCPNCDFETTNIDDIIKQ